MTEQSLDTLRLRSELQTLWCTNEEVVASVIIALKHSHDNVSDSCSNLYQTHPTAMFIHSDNNDEQIVNNYQMF